MAVITGCGGDDDGPTPQPTPPTPSTPTTPKGYPTVTVEKSVVNVFGGAKVETKASQLLIDGDLVASWTDENTQQCKVAMKCNGRNVNNGDTLEEEGTLSLTVTNNDGNSTSKDITLINSAVSLKSTAISATFQVGQEINILDYFTFADGITLVKTVVEIDGKSFEVADPEHFIPERAGNASVTFTVQTKSGKTADVKFDNITVNPMEYQAMDISNLQPKEILPIVSKVNVGDRSAYDHIEHLRIAEGTRVRDMMWQYGAGNYSPSEYQALMKRLYTGMIGEKPQGFDNFELVGKDIGDGTEHGHDTWDILSSIVQHANFIVMKDFGNAVDELYQKQSQNAINIFATSGSAEITSKSDYNSSNYDYTNLNKYTGRSNFLWFLSGSNLVKRQGVLTNKICQEDMDLPDEHSVYSVPQSNANSKNVAQIDKHIMISVGTNKNGDVDISNSTSGSKFPVGFHPDVLFSGRAFPFNTIEGNVYGEDGNYRTSYTNFTNLAMTDLCFQMYAEVADVDQLMNMIRATALTNKTHLDGKTQSLHLINPAGFILKYLMPTVPASLKEGAKTELQPGYYHGVAFCIPGAEVYIDGEWVPFTNANKDRIKGKNPVNLKWRLNGDLLPQYGYKPGDTITGTLLVIDDQWHGLNITKDITLQLTQ